LPFFLWAAMQTTNIMNHRVFIVVDNDTSKTNLKYIATEIKLYFATHCIWTSSFDQVKDDSFVNLMI
jgi:hypothetical protein